jgi:hypothetical protein
MFLMQFPLLAGIQSATRFLAHYCGLVRGHGIQFKWLRAS